MKTKIEYLVNKLNNLTKDYDEGNPTIKDSEWDKLYFELKKLEEESGIILPDSPTQKINYQVVNALEKIEHNHKMLSLDKTKDINEIINFIGKNDYVAMCKMDGLTCSLTYKNGNLVKAETRGNGLIGENILHNALVIPSIPKTIPTEEETFIVDGEIICTFSDFEAVSNEYKNCRNYAAGSIRLLDSKECSKRKLTFVAWEVIKGFESEETFFWKLNNLRNYGFTVVPNIGIIAPQHSNSSILNMQTIVDLQNQAEELGYPIDGIVFKFDNIAYGQSLGETSHHFKNAIAYKFYDETYPTEMVDIEFTMGRTGILTPVAVFKPIEIDGSIIERASLHNISIMYETLNGGSFVGQKIEVFKSNMIIPQIVSGSADHIIPKGAKLIPIPEICPICGKPTKIITNNNTQFLICENSNCEGKLINRLDHFCGKKGLDIKGLSKATLEKLIDWGWVSNFKDLFVLKNYSAEWAKKPGFGEKSVNKILDAIEDSKKCSLDSFITALGIPLIGTRASKDLIKHFPTWESFMEAIQSNFYFWSLPNFGPEMHSAIINFDYEEANELYKNYLTIEKNNDIIIKTEHNLNNFIFCVTGKLIHFKNRDELKNLIEKYGGKITNSVSKNTSYLINNDKNSSSSKNLNAKKLGIEILSEEEFLEKFDFLKNI